MASTMALASPGVPWVEGAAASGMSHGCWDARFPADMNKFPMPFPGAMSQQPIHNYPTTNNPPGIDLDDHEVCHRKGLEAYQEVYKQTLEERLDVKRAKQLKEEKEAKKAAAAAGKEPMKITLHPHALTALPSKPHPHPLTALPSKPSLPDPTNRGKVLIGPPPGLDLPEVPDTQPPSGLVDRASTWPVAPAMAKTRASSAVTTVPAMQRTVSAMQQLPKTSEGTIPFQWSVDTKKLHSSDKVCVSPSFEWHSDGDNARFKMMILPKAVNDKKCGSSFKKAKGRSALEIKCEGNAPNKGVKLRIAVTDRLDPKLLTATLPAIVHNFSEQSICTMKGPEVDGDWVLPFETAEAKFIVKLEVCEEDDDSHGDDDSKRIEEVKETTSVSWQSACCEAA